MNPLVVPVLILLLPLTAVDTDWLLRSGDREYNQRAAHDLKLYIWSEEGSA